MSPHPNVRLEMIDPDAPVREAAAGVVLICGNPPYLGGSATWGPLRAIASEYRFVEIDPLGFADAPDIEAAAFSAIKSALCEATAVIAHTTSAALVLEFAARRRPDLRIMLISPQLIITATRVARLAGLVVALLGVAPVGTLLTALAQKKWQRLKNDREYVREQLRFIVPDGAISDTLLDQAQSRMSDPLTERSVERTGDALRLTLRVLSEPAQALLAKATILVGTGMIDRKTAQRLKASVLPVDGSSAMLESPQAVADALRTLITESVVH